MHHKSDKNHNIQHFHSIILQSIPEKHTPTKETDCIQQLQIHHTHYNTHYNRIITLNSTPYTNLRSSIK